jgi:hypothetical protein
MWRGVPLAGVPSPWAESERVRLTELRLTALEDREQVALDLGHGSDLVADLTALVVQHPLRERLRLLLMNALYSSGRQAEALAVYAETRRVLVDELGVEPGQDLRRAHRQILDNQEAPPPIRPRVPRAPAQLPAAVSNFIGRAAEIDLLDSLVCPDVEVTGVAIITGQSGVGKTGLAVHWARRMMGRFPDGQLYVNLGAERTTGPLASTEALARLLRALALPDDRIPVDQDEAAAMYRSMIAGRRILVLLDNAETADQVRPLLPGDPGCIALVTSRHSLAELVTHDGARPIRLSCLSADEARTLLGRLLESSPAPVGAEAAAELARAYEHLPLALRRAATEFMDEKVARGDPPDRV